MLCPNCNEETKNPKYCSRKCATIVNNKLNPKRTKKAPVARKPVICKSCSSPFIIKRGNVQKFCNACIESENIKISDVAYEQHGKHHKYNFVRYMSRKKGLSLFKECSNCGYSKHIEIAHIKPVSEFRDDQKISEVNAKENLLALCPNCHWEFDHKNSPPIKVS